MAANEQNEKEVISDDAFPEPYIDATASGISGQASISTTDGQASISTTDADASADEVSLAANIVNALPQDTLNEILSLFNESPPIDIGN